MYVTSSLFATVLFAIVLNFCTSETIFIKTNNSDHQCPAEPCLTLQEFVSYNHRVESNTMLKFLPGNYVILFATKTSISVMDVDNVTLTGVSDHRSSVINCTSEFSVIAINVQNLMISNLSFFGCGVPVRDKGLTGWSSSSVTLFLVNIINVNILYTHVHDSKEAGMLAANVFDLTMQKTSFVGNTPNCAIVFRDEGNPPVTPLVSSYIADSEFGFGETGVHTFYDYKRSESLFYSGGLSLIFLQTSYTVYVNISNVALYNNTGMAWSDFVVYIVEWSCNYTTIHAEQIRISNGLRYTRQLWSSGLSVYRISQNSIGLNQENHKLHFEYTVHIVDSYVKNIGNTAVYVGSEFRESSNLRVKFTNLSIICSNEREHVNTGMLILNMFSMVLERVHFSYSKFSSVNVKNSKITIHSASTLENEGFGGVVLWKSNVTFLGDTVFAQNYGQRKGAIYAYSSTLTFQGKVEFVNNTGYDGGALALYAGSQIVIGRHAHLTFLGNHANHFGGAIYVDNYVFTDNDHAAYDDQIISCFYKPPDTLINTSRNPYIVLENNTAEYAGSALYGGWIDLCDADSRPTIQPFSKQFDSLFQVSGEACSSVIASNPLRICLCIDSKPNCSITQYSTVAYPGTTIKIPAVAVGQRFGTVPSTVHSDFLYELMNGVHPNIQDWQHTQKVEKYCTNLTYTIMSPSQVELTIVMEVENLDTPDRDVMQTARKLLLLNSDLYLTNLLINIKMLPCPLGFEYDNTSMMCKCDSQLVEHGLNCSIDTQTVWRKSSFWITTAEESGEVIVHKHCPFDYCKLESFDLALEDPDEQCAFRRSGILCGACDNNLSHVFGTSACRECSSLWALLWVALIAIAGIALVVLLIMLNLTVSVGTINGLIFYANIVRANHATFFPPNTTNSFLSWFIAWINLDLGIETCFYNGLDAYVKTWLQFVFPLYIWFLVIIIIVLSHYYTVAARLSGRNAVPVLATLFLISYAKLLRIIITVFQSTELEYPDNSVRKIWLYDGNVDYLEGKHIPLFIAALLLLLTFLPYTTILIFIQHLQHWSSYRVLFWVKKLKPLFDAYTGPYKDRHRYWIGLLLLVRIALFLIFSMNIRGSANINLLAISVTVLLLFMHLAVTGGVYKKLYLNIIEYSFFLNLGILASATLYTTVTGQGQTAVAYTSVSIAFVLFIIIVVFHILTKLKSTQHCNWTSVNILSKFRSALKKLCCKERRSHQNTQPTVTHATVELRESLLEYCSQ